MARLMAELDRAEIARRLQTSRKKAGFTQQEIADTMRVHVRTVQDWESPAKEAIPFDRLDEWAQLTSASKPWLLHGDDLIEAGDRLEAIEDRLEALVAGQAALATAQAEVLEALRALRGSRQSRRQA